MPVKPENVDQYLESGCGRCKFGATPQCKVHAWNEELRLLREMLQASGLTEEVKWSMPCYTHHGKNILMLGAFKESVRLSFFRGAQMKDPENILQKPGDHSRFTRYIRITDVQAVTSLSPAIPGYVQEAIEIESSGKRPNTSHDAPPEYPDELLRMFAANPAFEKAFSALTPGRRRAYLIHFSSAKQSKTRTARIEKCMPQIYIGKGWNER